MDAKRKKENYQNCQDADGNCYVSFHGDTLGIFLKYFSVCAGSFTIASRPIAT
jgi:hypothetical protein